MIYGLGLSLCLYLCYNDCNDFLWNYVTIAEINLFDSSEFIYRYEEGIGMKMKMISTLLVVFVILSAVFGGLWLHEKNDQSDLELLCSSSAKQSCMFFQDYQEQGAESDYWYGVAEFHSFMSTWIMLHDGDMDYIEFSRAYGSMAISPDKVKENMGKLLTALELFAADSSDVNGFLRLNEFNNAVEHGS